MVVRHGDRTITINSVIPPPPKRGYDRIRTACEVLAKLSIGDSTFIDGVKSSVVASRAAKAGGAGWYTVRDEGDGVRIWKIAEPTKNRT